MKFPVKHTADFAIVPAGNHVAICNAVVDLGLQPGSRQYPDPKPQVYLRFELPQEQIEYTRDGEKITGPMSIGRTFTASMSAKANLRRFAESWRGRPFTDEQAEDFDFQRLLGQRCLLNVTHTDREGKTYANIATATPLPKGMASTEPQHNTSLYYTLDTPDSRAYSALPEWLRKKIAARIQPAELADEPVHTGELSGADDEIPF